LVRSKATEGPRQRTLDEALIALTDCTRSLKDFETHSSTDRNSFGAHVLERASKTYPVDLWMLAKVVPKTLYLVELLAELFGLPAMYFDNILGTHCMTAATLFGLQEVAEAPKRIFESFT